MRRHAETQATLRVDGVPEKGRKPYPSLPLGCDVSSFSAVLATFEISLGLGRAWRSSLPTTEAYSTAGGRLLAVTSTSTPF
jgi:hypothetical protein